jgi:hypothetical protein
LRCSTVTVGQYLSQVGVVSSCELVLDDQNGVIRQVSSHEVKRVATDGVLGCLKLNVDAERLGEPVGVCEQPRREVMRLVLPPFRTSVDPSTSCCRA